MTVLMVAMEGGIQQAKRAVVAGATTPKKRKPEKPEIGSSSTWNHDQLELFKVKSGGEVDPKTIIPEHFFDFSKLETYQSGNHPISPWLVTADYSARQIALGEKGSTSS